MLIDVSQPGTCRSCKRRIYWRTEHKSGKANPYDAPRPCTPCEGNGYTDTPTLLGPRREACTTCDGKGRVQVSHFATCPQAQEHRKR